MSAVLERTIFETSRASEYFDAGELQAQTGQARDRFAAVILKELVDNALDACETAGLAPCITIDVTEAAGALQIAVADNGIGISAETVERITNFQTRTSDKAAYKAPTRGAQGNALKTVLGIPCALGQSSPVLIEAHGVRHAVTAWLDPGGELRLDHQATPMPTSCGTRISATVPATGQEFWPTRWARAFALVNPHASVRIRGFVLESKHAHSAPREIEDSYQPSIMFPGNWRKFLPTDLTSPWWYDGAALKRLVFAHIGAARRGARDLTLRDFVRQFRGLSGTAKAKLVCDHLPAIGRLTDFDATPDEIARLLDVMQAQTQAPAPSVLGLIGEEHLRGCLDASYGVKRWWYRKTSGAMNGIPHVFEVAIASTARMGDLYTAVNYSPTFDDPFAQTILTCPEFAAYGIGNFLRHAHASPIPDYDDPTQTPTAAVVHLVCPALEFLDRGKTRLRVPPALATEIAQTLWRATKDLYQEGERRRKDAARAERRDLARERERPDWSQKDAVFEVIPESYAKATGGDFPVSSRTLYYGVRDAIQRYTTSELDYNYFSQTLLTAYQARNGPLPLLYYDPRGVLYEPHTGREVQLGTREVDAYDFPGWVYDKILFVEKKGLWPVIKHARIAERYDMAVIGAEGYATTAARTLFANADKDRDYKLFVLHDADPYGYNIARTLREATLRMPDYRVEVIDLGLKYEEALDLGLKTETFTRKNALAKDLVLTEAERRAFQGRQEGKKSWICTRVELNAFSNPDFVAYLERKLTAAGATEKVIPPEADLPALVDSIYRAELGDWTDHAITELLASAELKQHLATALRDRMTLEDAATWIAQGFEHDRSQSWRKVVEGQVQTSLDDHRAALNDILQTHVRSVLERSS